MRTLRFQHWYPEWQAVFEATIRQNCSEPYQVYLNLSLCNETTSPDHCQYLPQYVVDCVLDRLPQGVLADTAAASVVLGLLPTVLSFAGSSTIEVGLLASRRPVLAFLLAAASPATTPLRSADYHGLVRVLTRHSQNAVSIQIPHGLQGTVSLAQYLVAMANVANLISTLAELSRRSVCSISVTNPYLPGAWAMVAFGQYILGALCFRMAVSVSEDEGSNRLSGRCSGGFREFELCRYQTGARIRYRKTSWYFICTEWLTSLLVICNIMNGSFIFASVLFVGARDVVPIAARLLASALVSRIVLAFELHGLSYNVTKGLPGQEQMNLDGQGDELRPVSRSRTV